MNLRQREVAELKGNLASVDGLKFFNDGEETLAGRTLKVTVLDKGYFAAGRFNYVVARLRLGICATTIITFVAAGQCENADHTHNNYHNNREKLFVHLTPAELKFPY